MRRAESGFSTIEVIAAVAIVAVALLPIAALHIQIARAQTQLAQRHAESTALHNALALLRDINPMSEPQGRRQLTDATALRWTSVPISPVEPSIDPRGFELQVFQVTAEIEGGEVAPTSVQVELVGWRALADQRAPSSTSAME